MAEDVADPYARLMARVMREDAVEPVCLHEDKKFKTRPGARGVGECQGALQLLQVLVQRVGVIDSKWTCFHGLKGRRGRSCGELGVNAPLRNP